MEILKKYTKDEMNVIEYTRDGVTVSHVVQTPIQTVQPTPPPVETTDQKIARLEKQLAEQNLMQMEVLATIYEQILGDA